MAAKDSEKQPRQKASMIEDEATEKLKQKARDLGLIVNDRAGKADKPATKQKGGKK